MKENLSYSSHTSRDGHILEIDRDGTLLDVSFHSRTTGTIVNAKFTEAEAEEIAASFARVYRNIRLHQDA